MEKKTKAPVKEKTSAKVKDSVKASAEKKAKAAPAKAKAPEKVKVAAKAKAPEKAKVTAKAKASAKAKAPSKVEAAPVKVKAPAKAKAPVKVKAPAKAKAPAEKKEISFDSIISDLKEKSAKFDAGSYQGFLAIQVTLEDLGRVFYVEVKDGRLSIEPYDYYDRQANLIMSSANFVKMINGKLNGTLAYTTGKLKIEGDVGRASELSNLFGK